MTASAWQGGAWVCVCGGGEVGKSREGGIMGWGEPTGRGRTSNEYRPHLLTTKSCWRACPCELMLGGMKACQSQQLRYRINPTNNPTCTIARQSVSVPSCTGVAFREVPTNRYTAGSTCKANVQEQQDQPFTHHPQLSGPRCREGAGPSNNAFKLKGCCRSQKFVQFSV